MKELGIYIHIPFCKQKCFYCDFISFPTQQEQIKTYIECVKREIQQRAKQRKEKEYQVTTIYIGGGTPSYIDATYIEELLQEIRKHYRLGKQVEMTVEVNPGTVTEEKLQKYKEAGVNRISIGLQSTCNERLKQIGRIHTYEDFLATYQLVRKIGIQNCNVDLILGLPMQTIKEIEESIQKIIDLNPEHISTYSLIFEENTILEKKIQTGEYKLPEEEQEREMYWLIKKRLEEVGYLHYEISNFAKKGYESKHNSNCWEQKEYLGFGLAAHSYYCNMRFSNTEVLEEYIKNIENMEAIREIHEIQSKEEKQKEYMLLGLRKIEGVSISKFKQIFIQNPIYLYHTEIEKLVKEELIEVDLDNIRLTKKGIDLANLVWEEFI